MVKGPLLDGRYELGAVLGSGSSAVVRFARDHRVGRDVAIKVLRSQLSSEPGFQARFRREAQNAAALNHPAIVAVYDTGEARVGDARYPVPYIVMEYVEGRTLAEILSANGRLPPQRSLEIVADVCAALEFSHRHGIVHRDIKPGNVMLTVQGAVKVLDFGIARAVAAASSQMTAGPAMIGAAAYMSPEQAAGRPVDTRADIYSTGCVLYELVVGEPPFAGDNPVAVAYQQVQAEPVPPSRRNPELSPTIDALVRMAMRKKAEDRYQTAGELRADVLRAAAGRRISAPALAGEPPAGEPNQVRDQRGSLWARLWGQVKEPTGPNSGRPRPSRPAVFICYRRKDAGHVAGRLADRLGAELGGKADVFLDVDAIEQGDDWASRVRGSIGGGGVMLVLIGRDWAHARNGAGDLALESPNDPVRIEVEEAANVGVPILPILVDGATLPDQHALPISMTELLRRNALTLGYTTFKYDAPRLLAAIRRVLE